jgi:predicted  nucleic acid-binding Zn-ribbon protein
MLMQSDTPVSKRRDVEACDTLTTAGEDADSNALQVVLQGRAAGYTWSDRRTALDRLCESLKTTTALAWLSRFPELFAVEGAGRLGVALCQHAEELRPSIVASACRLVHQIAASLQQCIETVDSGRRCHVEAWARTFHARVHQGVYSAVTAHVTSATAVAHAALEALNELAVKVDEERCSVERDEHEQQQVQRADAGETSPQVEELQTDMTGASCSHARATMLSGDRKKATSEETDASAKLSPQLELEADLEHWAAPLAANASSVLDYSLSVRKHISLVSRNERNASLDCPRTGSPVSSHENALSTSSAASADKENTEAGGTRDNGSRTALALRSAPPAVHRPETASNAPLNKTEADAALVEKNRELTAILQQYEATLETLIQSETESQACSVRTKLLNLDTENNQLKADLLTCTEAFEQLRSRYRDLKEKLQVAQENERRATAIAQTASERMDEMERYLREFKHHAEQKLTQAFQLVSQSKNDVMTRDATITSLEKALEAKRTECAEKDAAISEAMHMYRRAESSQEQLQARIVALENEMQALRSRAQTAESELEVLRSELAVSGSSNLLGDASAPLGPQLEELRSALAAARSREETLQRELKRLNSENQSLKARTYDHLQTIESLRAELQRPKPVPTPALGIDAAEVERLRDENEELHQLCNTLLEKLEALEARTSAAH